MLTSKEERILECFRNLDEGTQEQFLADLALMVAGTRRGGSKGRRGAAWSRRVRLVGGEN